MAKSREPLTVDIVELHDDGYGVASDGKNAVLGALPGERALVQPFTRKRKKLFSRILSLESTAPDRVTPACSAAGVCGGCSLQHLDHEKQLELKQHKLQDLFDDCQPHEWLPPLRGPVGGYRTKARLGVKYVAKKERALVGFREKLSPYIAEIDRCEVLAVPMGALLPEISRLVSGLDARASMPQIEVAVAENATALVFRHLEPLSPADEQALVDFGEDQDLRIYLQPRGPDTTHRVFPACEVNDLYYTLPAYDLRFEFKAQDFTQINPAINRDMVARALGLLCLTQEDRVLDLFCGIGNFSLPIARNAAWVTGIEGSEVSVARARDNAGLNGIDNCSFHTADLFESSPDLIDPDANKALLDPPRSGAELVCQALASSNIERVVYVSCNPATLARDARILVANGFQLDKAGIIDMFPHTTHVESIACFVK